MVGAAGGHLLVIDLEGVGRPAGALGVAVKADEARVEGGGVVADHRAGVALVDGHFEDHLHSARRPGRAG